MLKTVVDIELLFTFQFGLPISMEIRYLRNKLEYIVLLAEDKK